jgi:hypothetical protein
LVRFRMAPSGSSSRRLKAEQEFRDASKSLGDMTPSEIHARLGKISIPIMQDNQSVDDRVLAMEKTMDLFTEALNNTNNANRADKAKTFAVRWFRASYPFARFFLNVAQQGSAVFTP